MLMQKHKIFHLAVLKDEEVLIFSSEELLRLQRNSHLYFLRQIEEAEDKHELKEYHGDYRHMVEAMIPGGVNALTVSRFLTGGADAAAKKLIQYAIDELGEAPCLFSFIQMGSWGRQELSFVTDQDNAIIFSDPHGSDTESIRKWFADFGKLVCTSLDQFGYSLCKGGNMAMNPKWIKSLDEWKATYHTWMSQPEPNEVLKVMIFFDFRPIYGESELANELRLHILGEAPERPVFLWNLAQGCVNYKVKAALEGDTFDVKQALRPVVDYARLQALKHGIHETNTLARLHRIYEKTILDSRQYRSAYQIYEYLAQMRMKHQYTLIEKGYPPNNLIVMDDISDIDRDSLRRLLDQTQVLQNMVKREYKDLN
jgi:CBS domain-containing protein